MTHYASTCPVFSLIEIPRCISCYCCYENCPEPAVELKENMFLRLSKAFER